jgi:hypothetical protein
MFEPRNTAGFTLEPLAPDGIVRQRRRQHLNRDGAIESCVGGDGRGGLQKI